MLFPFIIIDLTHPLSPLIPSWNGDCGFRHDVTVDYADDTSNVKFRIQKITMKAGMGTHMDAPSHCISGGKSIADLDINQLIAPCVVVDVSAKAVKADERYLVTPEDIEQFEKQHGTIPEHAFVIIHTSWHQRWKTPEQYRNNLVFPSISEAAARLLLSRNIVGLGIDTLSPDCPDSGFPVHKIILGAGKYIVENVANSDQLPPTGSFTLALPIKIKDGTEAPIRLVGLIKK